MGNCMNIRLLQIFYFFIFRLFFVANEDKQQREEYTVVLKNLAEESVIISLIQLLVFTNKNGKKGSL